MKVFKHFIREQLETSTVNRKLLLVVILAAIVGNVSILGQLL